MGRNGCVKQQACYEFMPACMFSYLNVTFSFQYLAGLYSFKVDQVLVPLYG